MFAQKLRQFKKNGRLRRIRRFFDRLAASFTGAGLDLRLQLATHHLRIIPDRQMDDPGCWPLCAAPAGAVYPALRPGFRLKRRSPPKPRPVSPIVTGGALIATATESFSGTAFERAHKRLRIAADRASARRAGSRPLSSSTAARRRLRQSIREAGDHSRRGLPSTSAAAAASSSSARARPRSRPPWSGPHVARAKDRARQAAARHFRPAGKGSTRSEPKAAPRPSSDRGCCCQHLRREERIAGWFITRRLLPRERSLLARAFCRLPCPPGRSRAAVTGSGRSGQGN